MIQDLGVEGLAAVRVYGPEVAEVIAKEGPEAIGVLRKSGRAGWRFYVDQVLAHKKKLAAAGVLGLFLADPDLFVDTAGNATRYAAEQFARAGVALTGAAAGGLADGLLAPLGLQGNGPLRGLVMGAAALVAALALLTLLGLPIRLLLRPITWPLKMLFGSRRGHHVA